MTMPAIAPGLTDEGDSVVDGGIPISVLVDLIPFDVVVKNIGEVGIVVD